MAHPVLKGYHPTIEKQLLSNEVLETDTMDRLKDDFEDEDVDPDTLNEHLLYRQPFDRQKLLNHFNIAEQLTKDESESDPDIMKRVLQCLGDFPKYEKLFLADILSSNARHEVKFRFLEEVIFSKSYQFLERFVESERTLNTTIIDNLSRSPVNGNHNITNAVRAVLNMEDGENFSPFPLSSEMYEVCEGGRSLKSTYDLCRDKPLRQVFLKNLLLEADRQSNIPLVTKIIFSHCYIDLKSILDPVVVSEEKEARLSELLENIPDLSRIKELACLDEIEGELLQGLVKTAAFGSEH
ncbi:uncharacterized protein LOC134821945 [Bolinopsis microptera]|uniref:uncharacterized protein LOC134821945 n=1 Tax=Bolinopsis microptera TaxID=2820187 RepID=UPI00307A2E92